jgi:hypothetical protein
MGGVMAAVADCSGTMFHVLNASKGAAVQVSLLLRHKPLSYEPEPLLFFRAPALRLTEGCICSACSSSSRPSADCRFARCPSTARKTAQNL